AEEELLGDLVVVAGRGAGEQVVGEAERGQVLGDDPVVPVDQLPGAHPFLVGLHLDGRAVLVGAAHHQHLVARHSLVATEDVGRNAESGDVSDVARPVGVRPRDGGQDVLRHATSLDGAETCLETVTPGARRRGPRGGGGYDFADVSAFASSPPIAEASSGARVTASAASSTADAATSSGFSLVRRMPRMLMNSAAKIVWKLMISAVADGTTMRSASRGLSSPKLFTFQCTSEATRPPSPASASRPPMTSPFSGLIVSISRRTRRSSGK